MTGSLSAREPRTRVVQFPGGIRARFTWAGSGEGPAIFALTEAGGSLLELGDRAGDRYERFCRAEARVETPGATWTVRLASPIFDEPRGHYWDEEGLLVIGYGFLAYGLESRTGELRWSHRFGSPLVAVLGSSRLPHLLVQSEIETIALERDGEVRWRVAHSDVVSEAEFVGGRLVLHSYAGLTLVLDPTSGRTIS